MYPSYVSICTTLILTTVFHCVAMDQSTEQEGLEGFFLTIKDGDGKIRKFEFDSYEFPLTPEQDVVFNGIFDEENAYLTLGDREMAKEHMEHKRKQSREERNEMAQRRLKLTKENIQKNNADSSRVKYWIIWEIDSENNKKAFAQLGIGPCADAKKMDDESFNNLDLIGFGLNLHQDYRKSNLEIPFIWSAIKKLRTFPIYQHATFCLRISKINTNLTTVAENLGFVVAKKDILWTTLLNTGKSFSIKQDLYIEQPH